MTIRLRFGPRDIRAVDVRDRMCPLRGCFWPARHVTRAPAGLSGASSSSTDLWECGRREQSGCPAAPVLESPPRYRRRGGAWELL